MMFDSVESFIIRQLLKNTSRLTCSTSCGYVDRHFVSGEVAKWPTAPDCKSGLFEFARSNRAFSTIYKNHRYIIFTRLILIWSNYTYLVHFMWIVYRRYYQLHAHPWVISYGYVDINFILVLKI